MAGADQSSRPHEALERLASNRFFGRTAILAAARTALEALRGGRGHAVLLAGEAGIGKTRVADEVVALGQTLEVRPVWARCHELDGAPALWPWIQIARPLLQGLDASRRTRWLAGDGCALAALLTRAEIRGETGPTRGADRGGRRKLVRPLERAPGEVTDRHVLFEAFTSLLRLCAGDAPLLVVLDDLHWSDPASVLLARYAVRELRRDAVLLLGTYRDSDVARYAPLARSLGDLGRESEVFTLEGLSVADVGHFVEHVAGQQVSSTLVDALVSRTAGNPFFLVELMRWLAREEQLGVTGFVPPGLLPLPANVRHVLEHRLEALSSSACPILEQAAVLGLEFDVETLSAAASIDAADPTGTRAAQSAGRSTDLASGVQVRAALDEADRMRLVLPVAGIFGRFRFPHDLVRETLYDRMSSERRMHLHRRAADALVRTRTAQLDDHLAALAHHYLECAATGTAREAVDYAVRGADRAVAGASYELAVGLLRGALRAIDFLAADRVVNAELEREMLVLRAQIQKRIGDVYWTAGQRSEAEEAHRAALSLARELAEPVLFARAVLGLAGRDDLPMEVSQAPVALLQEALAELPPDERLLRVRLLVCLVRATYFGEERERLLAWAREAVEIAERIGDPIARFAARESLHYALMLPAHLDERLALTAELAGLARRTGSQRLEALAALWQIYDLAQVPDLAGVDQALARFVEIAAGQRQPFYDWLALGLQAARTLMEGDLVEAERLIFEAFELGQRARTPNALLFFGTQLFHLREEQGRVDELLPVMQKIVESNQSLSVFRIGIPLIHALADREALARESFEVVARHDFEDVPQDLHRLPMLMSAAAVCAYLGDVARAKKLAAALEADRGRIVVAGIFTHWAGPVDRALGQLEEALGDLDAAVASFASAAHLASRGGARLIEARALTEHARVLRKRAGPGDAELAIRSESAAESIYAKRGVTSSRTGPMPQLARASRSAAAESARFVRRGAHWQIDFADSGVQLPDSKGLAFLQRLVAKPFTDLHVLDLAALEAPSSSEVRSERRGIAARGGSRLESNAVTPARLVESGLELLDAESRRAYRDRLGELSRLEDEAEQDHDLARVTRLAEERLQIESALLSAYGAFGRPRRVGDPAERARKAVYNRIQAAITRIAEVHPLLGRHFEAAIRTGSTCSYRPEAAVLWEID